MGQSGASLEVMAELRCGHSAGTSSNVFCAGDEQVFAVIEDILAEVFELFPVRARPHRRR